MPMEPQTTHKFPSVHDALTSNEQCPRIGIEIALEFQRNVYYTSANLSSLLLENQFCLV